jgi:hypothetical protein
MWKGLVRIKCIDLANWAAMNNKLNDLPDGIRVSTEGMETLSLYPESADTVETLQANLASVLEFGIERFGEQNEDMCTMLKAIKNDMDDGLMTQSYGLQFRYPNAPYIDVVIKDTEANNN